MDPGPSSLEQTTTYTYEPLVGIKSITDPTGETITYEYDGRKRLYLIRNDDNNIIKRYRYNYATEENTRITADIHVDGFVIGSPTTFTVSDVSAYGGEGETTFAWQIDGETKYGPQVTHTYNTSGSKTVRLEMTNPEYGEVSTEEATVVIYSCATAIQNTNISEGAGASNGAKRTVTVSGPFTITNAVESSDWIYDLSVAADGKSLSYEFTANTSQNGRTSTVTAYISGCSSVVITVTQYGSGSGSGDGDTENGCNCTALELAGGCTCITNGCSCN